MRCSCTLYYHGLSIHDLFSYSLMISPVVCDRRVGLCGAVEFYEVALQNRLRLHREIYKWEIYKNIETQRQPITELAASSNMLQWTVNLRQTLCCQHCLWLKKTQQEKWKLCLILQRRQNTLINSGGKHAASKYKTTRSTLLSFKLVGVAGAGDGVWLVFQSSRLAIHGLTGPVLCRYP